MNAYRVEKVRCPVRLRLRNGPDVAGHVFLPDGTDDESAAARLLRLMNEAPAFLPVEVGDGHTVLLNKRRVATCAYEGPRGERSDPFPRRRVEVILEDGEILYGELVADGPEDRRRVLDCLNQPEPYLLLEGAEAIHVVRREAIECVPSTELGDTTDEERERTALEAPGLTRV